MARVAFGELVPCLALRTAFCSELPKLFGQRLRGGRECGK